MLNIVAKILEQCPKPYLIVCKDPIIFAQLKRIYPNSPTITEDLEGIYSNVVTAIYICDTSKELDGNEATRLFCATKNIKNSKRFLLNAPNSVTPRTIDKLYCYPVLTTLTDYPN